MRAPLNLRKQKPADYPRALTISWPRILLRLRTTETDHLTSHMAVQIGRLQRLAEMTYCSRLLTKTSLQFRHVWRLEKNNFTFAERYQLVSCPAIRDQLMFPSSH